MVIKYTSVHLISGEETLASLASHYRLSSWRAIYYAPDNGPLRAQCSSTDRLPPGFHLNIPPDAQELLKERLYALHRLRPLLLSHFDEQGGLLAALDNGEPGSSDFGELRQVESMLAGLQDDLRRDIRSAMAAAEEIAAINRGMLRTHLREKGDLMDLARASFEHPGQEGLVWTLTANIYTAWEELWSAATWVSKWAGKEGPEAMTLAAQVLNTIRSIVIQQTDRRINESQRLIWDLDAET